MEEKKIFKIILDKYHDSIGDVAYTQAGRMEDVDISQDGELKDEPDLEDLDELLEIFTDVMGEGAYGIAREAVREAHEKDSSVAQLDLPEKIIPKEVKAEKFASTL